MNSKLVSVFALIFCGIISYHHADAQMAINNNAILSSIDKANIPAALKAPLKKLAEDLINIAQGKSVTGTTLATDLQAVYDAAKAANINFPPAIDSAITNLISYYQTLGSKNVPASDFFQRLSPIGMRIALYMRTFRSTKTV
jgi:hypothetical protein